MKKNMNTPVLHVEFHSEICAIREATSREFADLHDTDQRIIQELFELKDRVTHIEEVMATKDDIHRLETVMEGLVTVVKKMDSDRYALIEWLKRHDINLEGKTRKGVFPFQRPPLSKVPQSRK